MNKNNLVVHAVNNYTKMVVATAFAYTKNTCDAEDIAQEVFLAFLKEEKEFESEEHLKSWLLRVTINKCKNQMKNSWMKRRISMPEDLSYMPQERHEVIDVILSLDKKYRLPIHLFYYEGYSIKEIAEILGEKPTTIGSRLDRGRKKLKILLGGNKDE